jgi:hypothetical protein
MKTLTVKLLTTEEAVVRLKNIWSTETNEKISDDGSDTLVFIVDKTSQADIKKAVSGAILGTIAGMLPKTTESTDKPIEEVK